MKIRSHALSSALVMLTSIGASAAECPPGSSPHTVDGAIKCILETSVVVVVDPEWLVAGGVVIALLVIATVYLATQVRRLAKGLRSGGRVV